MSRNSVNNLIVKLKISVSTGGVLTLLHLGAVVIVFATPVPAAARALWVVSLLASLGHALMCHALRSGPWAVDALRLNADDRLQLRFRGREEWCAVTLRSRFVHRWLVLLSVRVAGRRVPVALVLTADAVEADGFGRWRAALLALPRNPAA